MKPRNVEFVALYEASGWSPKEAAEKLETKEASISRYLNGKIEPKAGVLKLFKLLLVEGKLPLRPLALRDIPPAEVDDMIFAVGELREKFLAVERCAKALEKKAKPKPSPSSSPEDAARDGAKKVAASVQRPGVVYGRSRKAASPSGKTSSPSSHADVP